MGQKAFIEALVADMQMRHARWDSELWQWALAHPAKRLATNLVSTHAQAVGQRVLEAYLKLVASGIGEGYLFPAQAIGAQSVFHHLFFDVLPRKIPALSADAQVPILAQAWNLAENLEKGPAWLAQVFWHCRHELDALADLSQVVERITDDVVNPLPTVLDANAPEKNRTFWLDLSRDDGRFFPGHIVQRSPRILQVLDRERHAAGASQSSMGIWLRDEPVLLGSMGSHAVPDSRKSRISGALKAAARRDSRITMPFDLLVEERVAAATLKSSQFVVLVLGPAGATPA
jgi:hypothetical protein